MDSDIGAVVKSREECQAYRPSPPTAKLHPWEWPAQPWSRLHLDFVGPFMDTSFLVLVDAHSKWLDVYVMSSITTSKTVEQLRTIFTTHGLPKTVVTDNGPTFTSTEFGRFMKSNGIRHVTSTPYHPSTIGLAERAVQRVKQRLHLVEGATLQEKISKFLF